MAPRKGETHDEKAARQIQNAAASMQRARWTRVHACLKARPDLLPNVEHLLVGLGAMEATKATAEPTLGGLKKEEPGTPASKTEAKAEGSSPPPASSPSEQSSDGSPPWDRNVTKIGQVPPTLLKKALGAAEKSTFSDANMKSVTKRGQKTPPHHILLQCLELITNLDPGSGIDHKYRNQDALVEWISERNVMYGRRGRDLVLAEAINGFEDNGIFSAERVSKCRVKVTQKFTSKSQMFSVDATGDYFVDQNFSETHAVLRDRNSDYKKALSGAFGEQTRGATARGKQRASAGGAKPETKGEGGGGGRREPWMALPVGPTDDAELPEDVDADPPAVKMEPQQNEGRKRKPSAAAAQIGAKLPRPSKAMASCA